MGKLSTNTTVIICVAIVSAAWLAAEVWPKPKRLELFSLSNSGANGMRQAEIVGVNPQTGEAQSVYTSRFKLSEAVEETWGQNDPLVDVDDSGGMPPLPPPRGDETLMEKLERLRYQKKREAQQSVQQPHVE